MSSSMLSNAKRSGYTLPVFAVAAAKAALLALEDKVESSVQIDLIESGIESGIESDVVEIAIAQCARLDESSALGITISDPGDNLDLTAGTPVWAWVRLEPARAGTQLILEGGEGLGRTYDGDPAIYSYARTLAQVNLLPLVMARAATTAVTAFTALTVRVRFILPEGRSLATRTSNAAFGILEGLALLGTSGISQPLSVAEKLEDFRADLRLKAASSDRLAFCIGANSHQVALRLGFDEATIVQTSNWIGAMLVEAGLLGVTAIVLVGYHGKLLKLAGGIFNTSSHLADARIAILTHAAVCENLPPELIQQIAQSPTAEAVLQLLRQHSYEPRLFGYLAQQINQRAVAYVHKYADREINIETVLCDRLGNTIKLK